MNGSHCEPTGLCKLRSGQARGQFREDAICVQLSLYLVDCSSTKERLAIQLDASPEKE